jgi:hypothetical protein
MSIARIFALGLALMFVTTAGVTAFTSTADAGEPCCNKPAKRGK